VLAGGAGNDVLRGGLGADTFVFEAGGGSDVVRDFEAGIDLLDFTAFGTSFDAGSLTMSQSESGALLSWQQDGAVQQVLLEQVQVASLPDDAFLFA
jgi:Ca2+-binding RTX toxin-like protein